MWFTKLDCVYKSFYFILFITLFKIPTSTSVVAFSFYINKCVQSKLEDNKCCFTTTGFLHVFNSDHEKSSVNTEFTVLESWRNYHLSLALRCYNVSYNITTLENGIGVQARFIACASIITSELNILELNPTIEVTERSILMLSLENSQKNLVWACSICSPLLP